MALWRAVVVYGLIAIALSVAPVSEAIRVSPPPTDTALSLRTQAQGTGLEDIDPASLDRAFPVFTGYDQEDTLPPGGDSHWYSIRMSQYERVRIDVLGATSESRPCDTFLEVYDVRQGPQQSERPVITRRAWNNHRGPGNVFARVDLAPSQDGTYYVRVFEESGRSCAYRLLVSELNTGPETNVTDGGDILLVRINLTRGNYSGTWAYLASGNEHIFQVHGPLGEPVRAETRGDCDMILDIYPDRGTAAPREDAPDLFHSDNHSDGNFNARVEWIITAQDDPYLAKVRAAGNQACEYVLVVELVPQATPTPEATSTPLPSLTPLPTWTPEPPPTATPTPTREALSTSTAGTAAQPTSVETAVPPTRTAAPQVPTAAPTRQCVTAFFCS